MAKSDKDLQDIVGDAMGNDLLGTPKKKTPKTSTYSYSSGGSTYGSRRTYGRQSSYLWENDDQFDDEFENDLRQSPFGGRRTTSEDLPEIVDGCVVLDRGRTVKLLKSLEYAIGDSFDESNLTLPYADMQRVLNAVNTAVGESVPKMKYSHGGTNYSVKLADSDDK